MNFFKKIFSREPETVNLRNIELKEYIEGVSARVLAEDNSQIKDLVKEFNVQKKDLMDRLRALEISELINDGIPEREKHIMIGNRRNYLNRLYSFHHSIELPESGYREISSFCTEFIHRLELLNQETGKGYFILTNFFDKDMKGIAASIKKMEESVIKINSFLSQEKIVQYQTLFMKIRELNEDSIRSEKLNEDIRLLENEIKENKNREQQLQNRISTLKDGEEYRTHFKIEKERFEIEEEISKLGNKLTNAIKPMDKQMKKLMHDSQKKQMIADYLENPLAAFEKDRDFEILGILEQVRYKIEMDSDEIRDNQKEKIMRHIESVTKEYLNLLMADLDRLTKDREMLTGILERSTIIMDYKELQYQLDHVTDKLTKYKRDISAKKIELDKLSLADKSGNLEKELSEFTGKEVRISD